MLDGFIVPAAGDDDSAEFFHDIARQALYEDLAPPLAVTTPSKSRDRDGAPVVSISPAQ